jgi:hypothetical protein
MPNPYGRSGSPMQQPTKKRISAASERWENRARSAESKLELLEQKIREMVAILESPSPYEREHFG